MDKRGLHGDYNVVEEKPYNDLMTGATFLISAQLNYMVDGETCSGFAQPSIRDPLCSSASR